MTVDREAARRIAEGELEKLAPTWLDAPDVVLLDDRTLELPYGWVFFYQSRRHVEAGDPDAMLGGNAPLLVTREGAVHFTGTAHPLEWYLANFERTGRVHPDRPT